MAEDNKYLNQALLDGLLVFEKFLTELSPFVTYSLSELSEQLGYDYNKLMRIVKTLQHVGYVDVDASGKRYAISRKILELPLRYIRALHDEHLKIKTALDTFALLPENPNVAKANLG